jgi:hypothetical protein
MRGAAGGASAIIIAAYRAGITVQAAVSGDSGE